MTPIHRRIPQRKRIFVGGEGASECNYVKWLRDLCRDKKIPVTLDIHDLGRGGNSLNRIEMAARKIRHEEQNREQYKHKFLILDADKIENQHEEQACKDKATENGKLIIVWQRPCHEAFLLRHFTPRKNQLPATSAHAMTQLKKCWPAYQKNMPVRQIGQTLSLDGARRAAKNLSEFQEFLRIIGLLQD
ncbi:MAG: RloB domain-containing protein [Acidiphilium sp.]